MNTPQNWSFKQVTQDWYDTEAGQFFKESELSGLRICNAIMRHFIFQHNPHTGYMYTWKMEGTIEELELIANSERPIAGVGDGGRKDLQEVLNEMERNGDDDDRE